MQNGWCLICGSGARLELARLGGGTPAQGLPAPATADCRFVVCRHCGHVYQDPMPEAEHLWRSTWWNGGPQQAGSREMGEWLADRMEHRTPRRTLLFIGNGKQRTAGDGDMLLPFRERGWDICDVPSSSPALSWRGGGERPWARASGRKFSLVIRDAIERLPDPLPSVQALRSFLEEDGALFVTGSNLLDPGPADRMTNELLHQSHVRLYSPGMAQTVLARCGFQTEAVRAFRRDRSLGILAKPVSGTADHPFDDPAAILEMFRVLQWPGSTEILGWNLAALAETQPWVLPPLCRRLERHAFVVRRSGRCLTAVECRASEGGDRAIVRWGERDGYLNDPAQPQPGLRDATIIQLGLGSGELATHLAERLYDDQHLIIWEADPVLAKTVLRLVDLSPLWLSTQVSLLVGPQPELPPALRLRVQAPAHVYNTLSSREWNPWAYRQILGDLNPLPLPSSLPSAVEA